MVADVTYEPVINNLWKFGSSNFEGAFQVTDELFDEAVSGCELLKQWNLSFRLYRTRRTVQFC